MLFYLLLKGGFLIKLDNENVKPIYVQIAEWLEDEILSKKIKADEKVYSQYQLAEIFNINPATAAKGLSILLNENIVYKKRGLGMFVTEDANEIIYKKRKNTTLMSMIKELVNEMRKLNLSKDDIIMMIDHAIEEDK